MTQLAGQEDKSAGCYCKPLDGSRRRPARSFGKDFLPLSDLVSAEAPRPYDDSGYGYAPVIEWRFTRTSLCTRVRY